MFVRGRECTAHGSRGVVKEHRQPCMCGDYLCECVSGRSLCCASSNEFVIGATL